MPYAQLDDRYDDHRKVKRAWRRCPAAVGLHAMAITYCNRHKSDGELEADWVEEKLALLKPRDRQLAVDVLIDVGLFERRGEDFYVHDFLQWNRSAGQRDALAAQGRHGGLAKAKAKARPGPEPPPSQGSSHGYSQGSSEGSSHGSSTPRNATVRHVTPENTPSSAHADIAECFAYWQEKCGHPTAKLTRDREAKVKARLGEGYTVPEIRQAIDGAARGAFVNDAGHRFDDLELICRSGSKLEGFALRSNGRPLAVVPGGKPKDERQARRLAAMDRLTNGETA